MRDIGELATRLMSAFDRAGVIEPLTLASPGFTMDDGYAVLCEIEQRRAAAGWRAAGRKIGFTNRTIWARYNIDRPLVASIWDRTVIRTGGATAAVALAPFSQPRIEPEVVFGLRAPVPVTDDPAQVLACVEWIAAGFEIVQSHYPDWRFSAPDCAAGFGLHGALVVGTPVPMRAFQGRDAAALLESFTLTLDCDGQTRATGHGSIVLGSPLLALSHVARLLATMPQFPPLAAGEIVTTGTLTDALPVSAGEQWSADYGTLGVPRISVAFS
jgi:2-oxo-3-hexenedioate decarboxylase